MKKKNYYLILIIVLLVTSSAFGMLWNHEKKAGEELEKSSSDLLQKKMENIGQEMVKTSKTLSHYEDRDKEMIQHTLTGQVETIRNLGEDNESIIESLEVENEDMKHFYQENLSQIEDSLLLVAEGKVTRQEDIDELEHLLFQYGSQLVEFFSQPTKKEIIRSKEDQKQFLQLIEQTENALHSW